MADIQGTSLHYFIYMYIVQASSVSTTTCIDHHVFMVSFLSKMNYFAATVKLFSLEKNIPANILTCYQCSKSMSLNSFAHDSFVHKAIQKNIYCLN